MANVVINVMYSVVLLLGFLLLLMAFAVPYEVQISQQMGVDNSTCLELNRSLPCKTIGYALRVLDDSAFKDHTIFRFSIKDRIYILKTTVEIHQPRLDRQVIITAADRARTVVKCDLGNRFAALVLNYGKKSNTYNIHISDMEFHDFGYESPSVVLLLNSINITFTNCAFRNNMRAGINAYDSSVAIENCLFINNTNAAIHSPLASLSVAGGAAFDFQGDSQYSLVIRNTEFISNSAVVINSENYIPGSSSLFEFNRVGGGVFVIFRENVHNCSALIENTNFTGNAATFGGGLSLILKMASHNRLIIRNSSFVNNTASQTGGGIGLLLFKIGSKNTVVVKNCTVSNNWSRQGGGLSVTLWSFSGFFSKFIMQFDSLLINSNGGLASAAVRLYSVFPSGNPIASALEFIDCTIKDHTATDLSYSSPFTSQRVNVRFRGKNIFMKNFGAGALEHQEGVFYVQGELKFNRNSGSQGGAVLLRSSQIILFPGSELVFKENYASRVGGAIVVVTHTMYPFIHANNPDCFLAYSEAQTPPSKWKAKVSFVENSARIKGAAVYVSSLASCLWREQYPFYSTTQALRWNGTVQYSNNFIQPPGDVKPLKGAEYYITTDTTQFRTGDNKAVHLELSPGENVMLEIQGYDELNHSVYTSVVVIETDGVEPPHKLLLDNNMHMLSPFNKQSFPFVYRVSNETVYNQITRNVTVHQFLLADMYSTLRNGYTFTVAAIPCRPGFKFDDTKCVCDKSIKGVLRCDDSHTVYLKEGYWGGVSGGQLVTYYCPPKYCRCQRKGDLPGCRFDPVHADDQCITNRKGVLCGQCINNLSVGLRWEECIGCTGSGWLLGVVVIAFILLCILIIFLNPTMSSELRGPLFFFQVLPFVFYPSHSVGAVVLFIYNMLSSGWPFVYFLRTCIIDGMNNLYAVAIGYLMPFVTLAVFLISYVLSANCYLVKFKFRKNSSLHSFWLLTLFIYNSIVSTTFLLLHCPRVGGKSVFFFDGNIECFKGEHLPMAILALFVLCTVIIPLPIIVLVLTKGLWKVDPQYVSTLTNGLRPHCLWWWAVDMWRRVLLLATFAFLADGYSKRVLMIVMTMVILAFHSSVQPYKKARVNVVETLYLFVLCVLAIMQVFNRDVSTTVGSTLFVIASLHATVLTVYKAVRFFEERCKCSCPKQCRERRSYGSMGTTQLEVS